MNILERMAATGERIANRDRGPRWIPTALVGAGGVAIGALAAFLLDPSRGRSRRARLADQAAGTVRQGMREAERATRRVRSDVAGRITAIQHAGRDGDPFPDDVTLAAKVQTEVFGDPSVPKGSINVNVERGIVVLRGEVPDDAMRGDLVSRVERMPGVWAVRNLLHLPGETAPQETVATQAGA